MRKFFGILLLGFAWETSSFKDDHGKEIPLEEWKFCEEEAPTRRRLGEECRDHRSCDNGLWCGSGADRAGDFCQEQPCIQNSSYDHDCSRDFSENEKECATGYTTCECCCDINPDCICDDICGGNNDAWAPEEGYNEDLGCSYNHKRRRRRLEETSAGPVRALKVTGSPGGIADGLYTWDGYKTVPANYNEFPETFKRAVYEGVGQADGWSIEWHDNWTKLGDPTGDSGWFLQNEGEGNCFEEDKWCAWTTYDSSVWMTYDIADEFEKIGHPSTFRWVTNGVDGWTVPDEFVLTDCRHKKMFVKAAHMGEGDQCGKEEERGWDGDWFGIWWQYSWWWIVGGAISAVVGLILVIYCFCCRKRQNIQQRSYNNPAGPGVQMGGAGYNARAPGQGNQGPAQLGYNVNPAANQGYNAAAASQGYSAAAVGQPQGQLPPGWRSGVDPGTGKMFYINDSTQTTSWDRPAPVPVATAPPSYNSAAVANDGLPSYAAVQQEGEPDNDYPSPITRK